MFSDVKKTNRMHNENAEFVKKNGINRNVLDVAF